ncbi:hypothetical protein GSF70_12770 [Flavobacteriaceae bacterium W22]|nr:hypothetical protein [Flavobacteriaceae bacterium W22]
MKKSVIGFLDSEDFEKNIKGKRIEEIEKVLDFPLEKKCNEECIFILERYFFGLFRKRLYLYFHKGLVRDYFIG